MTFDFNTSDFVLSHGKEPRGYGSWAFRVEGREMWAPTSTYAAAKRWVRDETKKIAPAGYKGDVEVYVCT